MTTTTVRREVRKRGFFGWVFLIIFLLFNLAMLAWLIGYWSALSDLPAGGNSAEQAGQAIGAAAGTGMILVVWFLGAGITGLLALVTRGRKTIITETVQ